MNKVERGDVVVFNFPLDPNVNFIKRVIGLPGDKVEYRDKRLTINGKAVPAEASGTYSYTEKGNKLVHTDQLTETLGERSYTTLNEDTKPSLFVAAVSPFEHKDQCQYAESGMVCTVPAGQYLTMGDNRDNSHDGRYWGFVDDKLLVGKAFFVWMNLSTPSRIGHSIR